MAEASVNNQVCESCGAEVRLNAAFCFNCGSQVVPDEMVDVVNEAEVSNAWFKESITDPTPEPIKKPKTSPKMSKKKTEELKPLAVSESKPVKDETSPAEIKTAPVQSETPPIEVEPPTIEFKTEPDKPKTTKKPAIDSMRNKPKFAPRQKVEVTWERPNGAPNIWFLMVAVIFIALSVTLVILMLYLR